MLGPQEAQYGVEKLSYFNVNLTRNFSMAKKLATMYGDLLYRNTQTDLSVLFKIFAHFLGEV